ncbi:S10 family peptidase [Hansschlegelia zhihuaiae]|uniref:Peptidase S10 n=1 Tax=Hansschlegelia zhihuaiae TaxID=405005 RepID=A0A4Q0MLZ9_9HYPH|nr:peptidase S10 [Hansschlegelia zhihuaiae]RXF74760.1 peptidase S10 [Hansschlegelia zhihuaiae]
MTRSLRLAAAAFALVCLAAGPGLAQEAGGRPNPTALPPDASAKATVVAADDTLAYKISVEQVPMHDPKGEKVAEIVVTSYVLDRTDSTKRPITYAFNGGPGASSAWLNFGGLGPKRLAFGNQGNAPSDPPSMVDNAETWLAFTDLVFVDPVGTGYSRATGSTDPFYSVEGDVSTLSRVVAKHLASKNRLMSPVYLAGESYGGFRIPRIARELQSRDGVGVRGLVAVSPVLDFSIRDGEQTSPIPWVNALPSLAAAKRERDGKRDLTRADLADVEAYATGQFMTDLMKGPRDKEAVERLVARVSELTGVDSEQTRRLGGRVDIAAFAREFQRGQGRVGSLYDANVTSFDPYPASRRGEFDDPILDGARAPLTRAAVDFYARDMGYRVDRRYELISGEANRQWKWGSGRSSPESAGALREVLAADPKVRVIVAHGATDLVTPYMESKMVLDQLPAFGDPARAALKVYPGGHMFYTRDGSRAQFTADVKALYEATEK